MNDCKIYVGRVSSNVRERDLDREFRRFGRIVKLECKLGFAFVEYADPRDAEDAIHEMNGRELGGNQITVEMSKGPRPGGPRNAARHTDYRLIVEGLDNHTSWQDLKDFARTAGQVLYTEVYIRDGRKYGVVEYMTYEEVQRALRELDDTRLGEKYVRLFEDRGGGGRSRSRSPPRERRRYEGSPPHRYEGNTPRRYEASPPWRYEPSPPRRYEPSPPRRYEGPPRHYGEGPPRRYGDGPPRHNESPTRRPTNRSRSRSPLPRPPSRSR